MPANIPFDNHLEYYDDSSLHGGYQYVTLNDVVNNYILNYVGDDRIINNVRTNTVLFHAKRGLQELNYDALKEVKAMEIELTESLTLILPHDYVNYVRVSWVDDCGNFHPMLINTETKIADSYLQDNDGEILFDEDGNILYANENTYDQTNLPAGCHLYPRYNPSSDGSIDDAYNDAPRFGLETSKANVNGWFTIDKRSGVMKFSSNVESKIIVLEYISDGLEYRASGDIKINKLAEQALYSYINYMLANQKINIQEYIVRRLKKQYYNDLRIAKGRIQQLRWNELTQAVRGKSKWIK